MKTKKPEEGIHEGRLLYKLYEWRGLKQDEFSALLNKTRHWLLKAVKEERVIDQVKFTAGRVLNIPMEYWRGQYELPMQIPVLKEGETEYKTKAQEDDRQNLLRLNNEYQSKIIELQSKIIDLKDEIIDLKETIITMKR